MTPEYSWVTILIFIACETLLIPVTESKVDCIGIE